MPDDSDIDLTIKLGAFPMYVLAPINTAPAEIARSVLGILFIKKLGSPPAVLKKQDK